MVAPGAASGAVRLDFAGDPLCFSAVVVKLCHADAVAAAARCPEILAETVRIVCNERVGRVKNRPRRAIVLLKPDGLLNAEVAEEVAHVPHVRTSEGVDRLVVVTHGEDGVHRCAAGASSEPRQHLKPTVLQDVRVLELVDENVTEAVLIMRADDFIAVEKLVAAQKKLGKVHDAFALALLLVGLIDLDGGLVAALLACGVPNLIVETSGRTPADLGQLIYFFEYACGLSGYLLDVNPFDQPGVEAYKKNMFALLGKPGYEDRRAQLESKLEG